jgi:DNA topoisomerase-1
MEQYIVRKITKKSDKKIYHKFFDKKDKEITDKILLKKALEGLYIPPAYDDVKIDLNRSHKVHAIGYDEKKRPQYIYNKKYTEKQNEKKFDHMVTFGKKFKKILRKINDDLYSPKDSKEKQIAMILKLIMECHFRVGNERYSKKNNSYGTTTLETKHIKIKRNSVEIDFIGKKKVRNVCTVKNKKIIKVLKEKKRTLNKDDKVFTYRLGNKYHCVQACDVNKYLKQFGKFTTKNFRTWGANVELIVQLSKQSDNCEIDTKKNIQKILKESIQKVAKKLHNTPAVCKSNYLDPELIKFFTFDCNGFLKHFDDHSKENIYKKYIEFLENL